MGKRGAVILGLLALAGLAFLLARDERSAVPPETPANRVAEAHSATPPISDPESGAPDAEACEIRGEVKSRGPNRPPISGARVRSWQLDSERRRLGAMAAEATTGTDGGYVLRLPAPGRYHLVAEAAGHGLEAETARAPGSRSFRLRRATRAEVLVRNLDGDPIPGAVVIRRPYDGFFTIEIPCDDSGRAVIDWASFDAVGARAGELGAGLTRRSLPKSGPLVLTLRRMWSIGGTVEDENGQPIEGARIHLAHEGPGHRQIRSRADGGFLFDGVVAEGELRAWADGFAEHWRKVVRGDREVRIVLRPPVTLAGRVLDSGGDPVAGAKLDLESSGEHRYAKADDSGEFAFVGLDPSAEIHAIRAAAEDGLRTRYTGPFSPDEPVEIQFGSSEGSWAVVRVEDDEGNPLSGVRCWVESRANTDGEGKAALPVSVPAGGEVEVQFFDGGVRIWQRLVPTTDREDSPPFVVSTPRAREVRFRITDTSGRDIPEASLEFIHRPGREGPEKKAPRLFMLHEEVGYTVRVRAEGYATLESAVHPDGRTETVDLVLRSGARLRGRTDPSFALSIDAGPPQALVREDGTFDVEVQSGDVTLTAWDKTHRARAHAAVRLGVGEVRDLGELPLVEPREVTGVVTDESGKPLGGTKVLLVSSLANQMWWNSVTHGDGAFDFHAAAAGEWVLVAAKEGRAADVRVLPHGGDSNPLRLVCSKGGAVLRVRVRPNEPVIEQRRIRFPPSRVPIDWPLRERRTVEDGPVFVYRGLPPGALAFLLTTTPSSDAEPTVIERAVSLSAGETTEIEVRHR